MCTDELVRQCSSPRVECMRDRVVKKVADARHVDVGEAVQAASEVGRVVKRPKDAAELRVERVLRCFPGIQKLVHVNIQYVYYTGITKEFKLPEIVAFLKPSGNDFLRFRVLVDLKWTMMIREYFADRRKSFHKPEFLE